MSQIILENNPPIVRAPRIELENSILKILNTLEPGDRLPPEPDLSKQLGVSRAMLREVVTGLVERGLLIRRQGIGTFVANQTPFFDYGLEVLESLDCLARRNGIETQVLELEIISRRMKKDEIKVFSSGSSEVNVIQVSRVIAVKERPVAHLIDIVPSTILTEEEIRDSFHGSVYDILTNKKEISLSYSRTDIMAIKSNVEISKRLNISQGTALILLTAQLFSHSDKVADYSYSYFVPGQFKFHVMRRLNRP